MRCFISIELEGLEDYLKELQGKIKEKDVKLTLTKSFHLTLNFLGEIDEKRVEEIKKKLSEIEFVKFEARLAEIGVFPSENYIRVVWVGLEPEKRFVELANIVNEIMDFRKDKRFLPHVTLARVRSLPNKESYLKKLEKIEIEERKLRINKLSLMKSTLTAEGPIYEELLGIRLT